VKYSEILRNPHLNNLAAIIRVPFRSEQWRKHHVEVPFWTLLNELNQVRTEKAFASNRQEFVKRFCAFLVTLTQADPRLFYTDDDLQWFIEVMDSDHALVIISLLFAWFSAPDTMLTPAEAAEISDVAESTWRNKAAAGEIPGAFKKGKQWLLPQSVICSRKEVI
jgi:hypothetical protein